jgi:hypothetical protein
MYINFPSISFSIFNFAIYFFVASQIYDIGFNSIILAFKPTFEKIFQIFLFENCSEINPSFV